MALAVLIKSSIIPHCCYRILLLIMRNITGIKVKRVLSLSCVVYPHFCTVQAVLISGFHFLAMTDVGG